MSAVSKLIIKPISLSEKTKQSDLETILTAKIQNSRIALEQVELGGTFSKSDCLFFHGTFSI